ncbi:ABC-type proline/glycine betaine transport system, periplasmic component [Desulfosporosinus orientis DSM 765]|uniref:ABC-type proline/glycine betaine transport system, periplasmic component n=1 Tax=Desulfosporosinus orientis (strain ATCC 19365 / DSM 765 / NCIMB 8382 / VKM B-1628 / Singapore I) TaxID=768706 RepID=G7W7Q6_DESOD|nr:glycine betaine ABC transporter substrate-binding protein [Desulfosporosinus orientis]AET66121.1 ABC-type proline/glycine betaine transport system, periplasmic component [Desulfosporosinus orientis DSM 765]
MPTTRIIMLSLVCITLNVISFGLIRAYSEYSVQVFLGSQCLIILMIFLAGMLFKSDKASLEAEILDNLINGNLTNDKKPMNASEMERKLLNYQSNIRKVIAEVYGVARIAGSTGIYLSRDLSNIAQAADNITSSINYVASGNSEVANSVVKASENMTKIYEFTLGIKKQIEQIEESSKTTIHMVDEGSNALEIQNKSLSETIESFQKVKSVISDLKNRASEINSIVDSISNISKQINLLALNAAIEAARAGEAGRGFTVVASEVKKLAAESDSAATQVRKLIEKVNAGVDRSVEVIHLNSDSINEQEANLKNTEKSFVNINHAMNIVVSEIDEIFNKVRELTDFAENVNSDIGSISAVCQETAASSEEISAAIQENANSMGNLTERFNELTKKIEDISDELENYQYIKIAYNEYLESNFQLEVLKELIKRKLGFAAEGILVNNQEIFRMVAEGKADFSVSAMLPSCQALEMEYQGQLENLGLNLEGCMLGLVVPSYVKINSIAELSGKGSKFKNKIYSLQRRTNLGRMAGEVLESYELTGFTIEYNEEKAMLEALHRAIKSKEWIVITGWQPHSMFGIYDLKYLQDPRKVFGEEDHCATLVRHGLKQENRELYEIVKDFKLNMPVVNHALREITVNGISLEEAAVRYLDANTPYL